MLLPNAWKEGLLKEGDTQASQHTPDSCPLPWQAPGAVWDRGVLLLKACDSKGADALRLSPFARQKLCEETAQLSAREHICCTHLTTSTAALAGSR